MQITWKDLNKTVYINPKDLEKNRKWYNVDANWQVLWKLAVEIANKLMWKHKSHYCDFWDCWDFVVVQNAEKISVTWNKLQQKVYYKHSWYKGHLKMTTLEQLLVKFPERAIITAVKWMLPKNKLRASRLKRLKVFAWVSTKFDYLSPETLQING